MLGLWYDLLVLVFLGAVVTYAYRTYVARRAGEKRKKILAKAEKSGSFEVDFGAIFCTSEVLQNVEIILPRPWGGQCGVVKAPGAGQALILTVPSDRWAEAQEWVALAHRCRASRTK